MKQINFTESTAPFSRCSDPEERFCLYRNGKLRRKFKTPEEAKDVLKKYQDLYPDANYILTQLF